MPKSLLAKITASMEDEDYSSISEWMREAARRRLASSESWPPRQLPDAELDQRIQRVQNGDFVEGDIMASIRQARPRRAG